MTSPNLSNDLLSLSGKRVLVTGASRGIGRAIAILFAAAGADVAIQFHSREDLARSVVDDIKATGNRGIAFQADLSILGSGGALARKSADAFGQIDILVLNAAEQRRQNLSDVTHDMFVLQAGTGFGSSFELVQALLPAMQSRKFGQSSRSAVSSSFARTKS